MSKTIVCYEKGYKPTPEQRVKDEKQIEAFVGYIRIERELKDLKRSFRNSADKSYTGQQIHQVINTRLEHLKEKATAS